MRLLPVARIQREPAHSYFRIGHNTLGTLAIGFPQSVRQAERMKS
jgi:hypothetical protein